MRIKHEISFWVLLACVLSFCASPAFPYDIEMNYSYNDSTPLNGPLKLIQFVSPIQQSATFPEDNTPHPQPNECTIVRAMDDLSSSWYTALCQGVEFAKIQIIVSYLPLNQTDQLQIAYVFKKCHLKSVRNIVGSNDYSESPVEEMTFIYKSVEWKNTTYKNGSTSGMSSTGWDFTNKGAPPIPTPTHTPTFTPTFTPPNTPTMIVGEVTFPTPTDTPAPSPTPTKPQIAPTPPPVNIPVGKVHIFDDLSSTENLVNGDDVDPENNRQLVLRWNADLPEARDYHVYVGSPEMELSYLGRTASGEASYFEWKPEGKYVSTKFISGPQNEMRYHFVVFVLGQRGEDFYIIGEYSSEGEVMYRVGAR